MSTIPILYYPTLYVNDFTLNISGHLANVDLKAYALARGWSGTGKLIANFVGFNAGGGGRQYISNLTYFNASHFIPGGLEIILSPTTWLVGSLTYTFAIDLAYPITITNNGIIAGAGGQGGSGANCWSINNRDNYRLEAWGGSGGWGDRLNINTAVNQPAVTFLPAEYGYSGKTASHNGPVTGPGDNGTSVTSGGGGGSGGEFGRQGYNGFSGGSSGPISSSGCSTAGPGDPPGRAINVRAGGSVTWKKSGDYRP